MSARQWMVLVSLAVPCFVGCIGGASQDLDDEVDLSAGSDIEAQAVEAPVNEPDSDEAPVENLTGADVVTGEEPVNEPDVVQRDSVVVTGDEPVNEPDVVQGDSVVVTGDEPVNEPDGTDGGTGLQ